MGSFKYMTMDNYKWSKQRWAMRRYAHWKGLTPSAAALQWCIGGAAEEYGKYY